MCVSIVCSSIDVKCGQLGRAMISSGSMPLIFLSTVLLCIWCSADIFRSVAFRCQDRRSRLFSLISVAAETVSLFRTATACQQDPTDIKVTVFVNVLQMYVKRVGELTLVNFLAKIWT